MRMIIRWGALLLGVLGCLVYVWTGLTSDESLPWLNGWMAAPIIAFALVPTVFSMTSGPSHAQFRGGALAIGTLVEMRRTGLSINDQPQMDIVFDVETANGSSFRGTARQIIDLTDLAMLTPGTILPVRYLPEKSDGRLGIATDADPNEVQTLLQQVQLAKGRMTPKQVLIAQQGMDAQAVVMEMRPTGEVRQGDAVIELLLRVTRPDGSTYDTRFEKTVSSVAIPGVQPGMVLRAKYLPDDEADVSIEVRFG